MDSRHPAGVLRFAICQMLSKLNATEDNMAEACRLATEAAEQGAQLILLPEGCLTGNAISGPARQATLPTEPSALAPLCAVSADKGITICAGFATPCGGMFNIVHAVVQPEGKVLFQHKAFRASTEPTFLTPWPRPERIVFYVGSVRVVIAICSEFGAPGIKEEMQRAMPHLILHPSAGCMKKDEVIVEGQPIAQAAMDFDSNCSKVVSRAAESVKAARMPRLGANPIGFDGETWWPGNSYAIDGLGNVVSWLKGENHPSTMVSSIAVADMPLDGLKS
jgi:predicted amidohydrolase